MREIISDNMWKESAINATDFVAYPVMISTKKNDVVRTIIVSRRHVLPEKRPILMKWNSQVQRKLAHYFVRNFSTQTLYYSSLSYRFLAHWSPVPVLKEEHAWVC